MPFKLFEFLEQLKIGAFLITLTQIEKTGSTGKVFCAISKYECGNGARLLLRALSEDEFQLNSKSAYIYIKASICMNAHL